MLRLPRPRVLALTSLTLAAVQAVTGAQYLSDAPYLSLLLFLASFFGILGSAKLWRDNCFESRFGLAMIAGSTVVGHALSLTLGLPGSALNPWSGVSAILSAISLAVALLVLAMLLPRFFSNYAQAGSEAPV
ncbi:hypothetical protein [Arthrobacter sp.]|uniref:hypothetical protein n=1 Tax=Arthrobacter sp. TaxID=1667 RepID=UPI002810FB0D|nr:hypothetical protein [Arthrobacter sp.]